MPSLRRSHDQPEPVERSQWRPQPYGHGGGRSVKDPLIEPGWGGLRVLVRLSTLPSGEPEVALSDEDGIDCTDEFADQARAIAAAAGVTEAVIDGFLTIEPTQESKGVSLPMPQSPTGRQLVAGLFLGDRSARGAEARPDLDQSKPIAFVAVDLLSIDGTSLIDLPLLERKRLLDSAVAPADLVRITPFIRPPLGSQALSWHAVGFREVIYKPANSRYRVDGRPGDWAVVPIRTR